MRVRLMQARAAAAALSLAALFAPSPAHADGAWQTFLRPTAFTALVAQADTVWCVSMDAGLIQYTPSRRAFTSYVREPNGLASNLLSSIAFDRSRRLWLGTMGSGASVLSADRGSWSLVNAFDGLPSDTVNTLTAQGDSMWIGTTRGFAVWDGNDVSGVLPDGINPSPFASDDISGIILRGDTVWVATRAGVYRSRLSQGLLAWTSFNAGLLSRSIDTFVDDGTTLFALAGFAVYRFDAGAATWVRLGGLGAMHSLTSSRGAVFAGSDLGLYRWNGTAWGAYNTSLPSSGDSPLIVALDEAGRGWAAGRPATRSDLGATGLYSQPSGGGAGAWGFDLPPGPPGNSCLNVDTEGDRVYVTTYTSGIGRLQAGTWKHWFRLAVPSQSDTAFRNPLFTYSMLIDKDSRKWFLSWAPRRVVNGICVPDTGEVEVLSDGGGVNSIQRTLLGPAIDLARWSFARGSSLDSLGGRWFGLDSPCADQNDLSPAGLLYYRYPTSPGQNYNSGNSSLALANNLVLALTTDKNKRMWLGTGAGLYYFDKRDTLNYLAPQVTRVFGTDLYVVHGLVAFDTRVWAYTPGNLYLFDILAGSHGSYNVPAGPSLQATRPIDVRSDGPGEQTVWLGTSNGVRAYHVTQGGDKLNKVTDYTVANSPLADDEVRAIHVDHATGVVWIATAGGLNRFDPNFVSAAAQLPSLSITAYPNPARTTALGVAVRLRGNGTQYTGAIYDLNGRRVNRFSVLGNARAVWNGRDENNELARPGIYFLRAESGGRSSVVRIVVLR